MKACFSCYEQKERDEINLAVFFFFPFPFSFSSHAGLPFSRSVILWCREVRVDSTLPRCSVSLRSPSFPSSMLFTRDSTCFSKSSILLWSRSFRLFACADLLLLLICCREKRFGQWIVLDAPFFFFYIVIDDYCLI